MIEQKRDAMLCYQRQEKQFHAHSRKVQMKLIFLRLPDTSACEIIAKLLDDRYTATA